MMRPSSVRWGPGGFGAFSKRQGPSLREGGGCLLIPLRVESLQDASHPPFERGQGRRGRVAVRGGRDVPCLRLRMVPTLARRTGAPRATHVLGASQVTCLYAPRRTLSSCRLPLSPCDPAGTLCRKPELCQGACCRSASAKGVPELGERELEHGAILFDCTHGNILAAPGDATDTPET